MSFDIESYFPSVPIPRALKALEIWLDKQNIHHLEKDALLNLTEVCLNQTHAFILYRAIHDLSSVRNVTGCVSRTMEENTEFGKNELQFLKTAKC